MNHFFNLIFWRRKALQKKSEIRCLLLRSLFNTFDRLKVKPKGLYSQQHYKENKDPSSCRVVLTRRLFLREKIYVWFPNDLQTVNSPQIRKHSLQKWTKMYLFLLLITKHTFLIFSLRDLLQFVTFYMLPTNIFCLRLSSNPEAKSSGFQKTWR